MIMWAIQIFLAIAVGAAGTMKLVRSKAQLAANPHMGWVLSVPDRREPAAAATALAVLTIVVATFR